MKKIIFLLLISLPIISFTQSEIALGEWKTYFPYEAGLYVTQSDDYVYYMANEGIVQMNKEDKSLDFITTEDGLSGTILEKIKFSPFENLLIAVYGDSNVDLIFENEIFNLNNIATNTNIIGSRKINDIYVHNRQMAYFSTDFGIVELNLERREFGFTAFTPISVRSVILYKDFYYAATDEGIYRAPVSETFNPADFALWKFLGSEYGLPEVYESKDLQIYKDQFYAIVDESIYRDQADLNFTFFDDFSGFSASFLSAEGRDLLMGYSCNGDCDGKLRILGTDGSISAGGGGCIQRPVFAIQDETAAIWYADLFRGFRRSDTPGGACFPLRLNSPYTAKIYDLHAENNQVYLTAGGTSSSFNFIFRRSGFSILQQDGIWDNVNDRDNALFKSNDLFDILYILPHPANPEIVYAGSYGRGLVEYRGPEEMMIYNQTNSTLDGTPGTEEADRVSGMAFDDENNLWISNFLAAEPLSVFKADGTWQSFNLPSSTISQLAVDQRGYKWIVERGQGAGFIVFDEGDIDDLNDDRVRRYTTSNSELTTNNVTYIAIDREGDAWVGTDQGPVIFECGDPFSTDCSGSRRKVDQDGFIAFLLETEQVNSIAIDGANRKWFGTNNGVFVQSPNGETQIHHFTVENSPLPANQITDIAINQDNGEVFIGTVSGLISYRSDATEGGAFHENLVRVFPNPVRPDYDGPIAIDGLAEDALVKITDVSGKLVTEIKANGGQAIWEGRDIDGNQVASGVYLVFSSTTDSFSNPDGAVAKILYVR